MATVGFKGLIDYRYLYWFEDGYYFLYICTLL